ncbi:MBL fold metallo-hydrolase [Rosettibacter firmus]|uniref:MBL fold metallo-hydrolase n=1 Tax=Rosettibacter firmus TaxID=3111522 RepID=UPI00336C09CD
MIKFIPLGGADEVGASCFYININGTGILLDCGIHPRKKGIEALPEFNLLKELPLDFVLISHAHQDHIGSLPFLIQQYPHVIIYTTTQTKEIASVTLHNAANILQESYVENSFKIYTHEEIDLLVRSIISIDYNETISVKGLRQNTSEPINITFIDAGHILGSASILIEYDNQRLLYTGDINLSEQTLMIGAEQENLKNINTLILESTYGSTDSKTLGTWESETKKFVKSLNMILHNGGSVLVPVFALGKTQEMLALIFNMMKNKKLIETNLYTGGIGREISRIYDNNRYIVRRKNPELDLKEIPQLNLSEIEDYNEFRKNPGIVLASSGMMLEGTTSYKLLDFWLNQKDFAIFGVGYMDPETPGYKVLNSHKGDYINLNEYSSPKFVNFEIEKFHFPSHSKREDLLKIVELTSAQNVILVHGDINSKDWLGYNILKKFKDINLYSAENRKEINLP